MALPALALPYGLRDVKITPYNAAGVLGTSVDLPASQTLSFTEAEDFEELRGDDQLQAVRGKGAVVNWELEAGGISLDALAVLAGGTNVAAGTTPSQTKTFTKTATDARPYFKIEGQAISDSGGDVRVTIFKAKVNGDIEGEFADGAFFVTSAGGIGLPNADGDLYEFKQSETEDPI